MVWSWIQLNNMWNQCLVLVSALMLSHAQQLSYTKNSVYYASMGGFPTQSTLDRDESSKEVLKELGVDISNEGKDKISLNKPENYFSEPWPRKQKVQKQTGNKWICEVKILKGVQLSKNLKAT